jgi:hypothetical protein
MAVASHDWVDSTWRRQQSERNLPTTKGSSVDWRLVNVARRALDSELIVVVNICMHVYTSIY